MKNKTLVIKGHPTRGKEVIEILVMLGGNNYGGFIGNTSGFYFIDCNNNINLENNQSRTEFITFSLEEFLEKYPFKVGDKVTYKNLLAFNHIYIVKKMVWENNQIKYIIHNPCCDKYSYTVIIAPAEDLQLHEDEIYIDSSVNNNFNNDSKPGVLIDGEKLIAPKNYTIKTVTMDGNNLTVEYAKKKPEYPKTYEECCKLLSLGEDGKLYTKGYKASFIQNFQKLLICRDAYWKIVGEELGLGKPWKPENPAKHYIFVIDNFGGVIRKNEVVSKTVNRILFFPTKEMRDVFYENFKDLIEECKEFL